MTKSNFVQVFANGGSAQSDLMEIASVFINAGHSEEEAVQFTQLFVKAAKGAQRAKAIIAQLRQQGANDTDIANQIVSSLQNLVQQAQQGEKLEYLKRLKKGGKAQVCPKCHQPISKCTCGSKVQQPKKATKGLVLKAPCSCTSLKRVGGKIIEVDCNETPTKE